MWTLPSAAGPLLDLCTVRQNAADFIRSKLKLLLHLLETENVEEACKKIQADSSGYERVRIWRRVEPDDKGQEVQDGAEA